MPGHTTIERGQRALVLDALKVVLAKPRAAAFSAAAFVLPR
jgi:hypothetical protein